MFKFKLSYIKFILHTKELRIYIYGLRQWLQLFTLKIGQLLIILEESMAYEK